MGSKIEMNCNSCDIHDSYVVGVGFSGIGHYLCACRNCGSLVERTADVFASQRGTDPLFSCQLCQQPLELLPKRDGKDNQDYGPCPRCTGYLYAVTSRPCRI